MNINRPNPLPGSVAPDAADRMAARLLKALEETDAYAFDDPLNENQLAVRHGRGAVSLGGGRFPAKAGEHLLKAGLVERTSAGGSRLVINATGRARLRRNRASTETRFLAQHLELASERGTGGSGRDGPMTDLKESPLTWLARRRDRNGRAFIDAAAYAAGERLRKDVTLGGMLPRMAPDWAAPRVDGAGPRDGTSATDTMIAARQSVEKALEAIGPEMSGLLIDLCAFLKGLEQIELERGWPGRSAKVIARIALDRLADHYGLQRQATGPERGRMRLWRDPDTSPVSAVDMVRPHGSIG